LLREGTIESEPMPLGREQRGISAEGVSRGRQARQNQRTRRDEQDEQDARRRAAQQETSKTAVHVLYVG
jgi:hypothetical protein